MYDTDIRVVVNISTDLILALAPVPLIVRCNSPVSSLSKR